MKKTSGIKSPALFGPQAASGGGSSSAKKSDFVQIMQQMMAELSEKIIQNPKEVFNSLPQEKEYKDASSMEKDAKNFGNTAIGFSGSAAADGLWGGNTKTALDNINAFLTKSKINEKLKDSPVIGQADDKVIDDNARDNIAILKNIFSELKLGPSVHGGGVYGTEIFDHINPKNMTQETAYNPFIYGDLGVTQNALSSLLAFFEFSKVGFEPLEACQLIQGSKIPAKRNASIQIAESDVSKIAKEIIQSSIITLGQIPNSLVNTLNIADKANQPNPTNPGDKKTENIYEAAQDVGEDVHERKVNFDTKFGTGLCVNQFETILIYFWNRANNRATKIQEAHENNDAIVLDGNGKPARRPIDKDMQNANLYLTAAQQLYQSFINIKPTIISNIQKAHPGENNIPSIISAELLSQSGVFLGRGSGGYGRGGANYGYHGNVDKNYGAPEQGPLSEYMDLKALNADDYGFVDKLIAMNKTTFVDLKDWEGGQSWKSLAETYSDNTPTPEGALQNIALNIRKIVEKAFNDYSQSAGGSSRSQHDLMNRWIRALDRQRGVAQNSAEYYGRK